jgi:hypothetical protein
MAEADLDLRHFDLETMNTTKYYPFNLNKEIVHL